MSRRGSFLGLGSCPGPYFFCEAYIPSSGIVKAHKGGLQTSPRGFSLPLRDKVPWDVAEAEAGIDGEEAAAAERDEGREVEAGLLLLFSNSLAYKGTGSFA